MDGKAPQCSLQKPDAVKVDLPSLSTPKSEKPMVRPSLIFILVLLCNTLELYCLQN